MKILLFSIFLVLLLFLWPKNEAQMQTWNHFWAIRPTTSLEEGRVRQKQIQQQYSAVQSPVTNNNLNYATMYDPRLYRLQKKPFGGPFGETQFEYVLRRW